MRPATEVPHAPCNGGSTCTLQLRFHMHAAMDAGKADEDDGDGADPDNAGAAVVAECVTCMEEHPLVGQLALTPCGHAQLCSECAHDTDTCPTCRSHVDGVIRVYT